MRADKSKEGMILIHPYFWGTEPIGSEVARDPKERKFYEDVWKFVNSGGAHADDPMVNVMAENAPSLKGLPCERVMVAVAGKDALVERGRAYYQALKGSGWGGEVELVDIEDVEHCFHLKNPEVDEAMGLIEKMAAFFAK
ncbi:uncharacterized protein A4U43_C08F22620 [Asparagus officinalis]|nr:uncharacterized protein A4U43_C08F22620 [Asparagus officinalis]